jgi:hypothetical protein
MRLDVRVPAWATHYLSDHTDMDRRPQRVNAERVPRFTLNLPDDVRFEYAFRDATGAFVPTPSAAPPAATPGTRR